MKNLILILSIAFIVSCSSSVNPPNVVLDSFGQKFAQATNVKWGKENATEWEAEFTSGDNKLSANYSGDGTWLETETEIPVSQLPVAVSESAKKLFPDYSITGADRIDHADGTTTYEADLKSGTGEKEASFKPDGTLLK